MSDVCAQTAVSSPTHAYCGVHGGFYVGACPNCAAGDPAALVKLIGQLRAANTILEARITDQGDEIVALRRRINELEQGNADRQRAHNALVTAVEQLQARP
jgi:hypothetical protein